MAAAGDWKAGAVAASLVDEDENDEAEEEDDKKEEEDDDDDLDGVDHTGEEAVTAAAAVAGSGDEAEGADDI